MIGLALAFASIILIGMTTALIHDVIEGRWGA